MTKRSTILAFAFASALAVTTGAAYAANFTIGPGGITVDPGYESDYHHHHHHGISRDDAVNIAHHYGVRHVESVDEYHGNYEVSGTDRHHHDITVTVDGDNGDVINIDRS